MGDMENLLALQQMMQGGKSEDELKQEKEQRFIADASRVFLGENLDEKALKQYRPERLIPFLDSDSYEIQQKLGGEWAQMSTVEFDNFVYFIQKKIKKSGALLNWES